jgi:prepilin-type N-terminal cleavage/methylation domain-containing protein
MHTLQLNEMKNVRPQKSETGFSLIELLIVSVILVIILGIVGGIVVNVQRSYTRQRTRAELINDTTAALDIMIRLVRMAGNNPNNISTFQAIDPGAPSGGIYNTIRIRSDWRGSTMSSVPDGDLSDPFEDTRFFVQNNKLMKQETTDSAPVEFLDNVSSLQFVYFDTNNAMIVNPNANPDAISRIEITITAQFPDSAMMIFSSSAYVRQR